MKKSYRHIRVNDSDLVAAKKALPGIKSVSMFSTLVRGFSALSPEEQIRALQDLPGATKKTDKPTK